MSQRLAVVHTAVHHLVSQRLVHALRYFVVDPGIRGHLEATLAACPVFPPTPKFLAYPPVPVAVSYVPTFYIAHRARRVAAVGVGAQVGFQETSQDMITRLGDQDDERQSYYRLAFENLGEFPGVLPGGSVGPQGFAQ